MSELPEGWGCCKVQDLFKSFSGGTPSRENAEYWNGNIPWLSSGDIKSDRIDTASELITESGLTNSSAKLCRPGSVVVVVRSGILKHTLPVAILEKEAAINQDIKCFDSGDESLNQWLAFSLKALSKEILSLNREGTTVQSVEYGTLKEFELRVPPLAEQRRIAAKLKPLLSSVAAYQQRFAKIPVILKRFRRAVLAAACSGRLTADWREEHANVGPVFPLLQETDADNQNDLPETWAIVNVGDTISGLKYGTSQKCSYEKDGTPVLRIPNIGEGVINQSDLKYADLPANELEQLKLHPGDVLLIRSNGSVSLVGKAALVRESEEGFAYAGYLIRLRPNNSRILSSYLNLVLGIRDVRHQIEIPARSTSGVNNINSDEVKALKIPLPPLAEQAEIVRHVESLFILVDQLEARYRKAKAQVDKLPQSILAKAFRGELVPTEAELARREGRDYEPASVLLERIRSERAEHARGRKEKARAEPKPTTKRDVDELWSSSPSSASERTGPRSVAPKR